MPSSQCAAAGLPFMNVSTIFIINEIRPLTKQGLECQYQHSNPCKVGMTRLELATSRPPDVCANQLRYIPCFLKASAKLHTCIETAKFIGDFYSKKVHFTCFSAIFRTKTRYSHALTALHTQHIRAANTEHGDTFSGNSA